MVCRVVLFTVNSLLSCLFSVKPSREEGFHLDVDDYLTCLLNLASELVSAPLGLGGCRGLGSVALHRELRHGWRLRPAAEDLALPERPGRRLPAAQPQERLAAQALRRAQVRREEGGGGGLRPDHPRLETRRHQPARICLMVAPQLQTCDLPLALRVSLNPLITCT